MSEVEIPLKLYRGIEIRADKLTEILLSQGEMLPPYPAKIDEHGRKVVNDGNEYGIYTSDNLQMVLDVYGNPDSYGTIINDEILIGERRQRIAIPAIGLSYEIDTAGIDSVREPFICSTLKGHYNNGFQGKEWIADSIPRSNYKVIRIRIGADLLNNQQDIPVCNNINESIAMADDIIQQRIQGLKFLESELSKMPADQRLRLDSQTMGIYKKIFGLNGYVFQGEPTSQDDYLMKKLYLKDPQNIDIYGLKLLEQLKISLNMKKSRGEEITLEQLLQLEIANTQQKKQDFISKRLAQGEQNPINLALDKKENSYVEMLNILSVLDNNKSL